MEHFDAILIGGGLSGIAAGYRLQYDLKGKTYIILEGRDTIGGTWDLFRLFLLKLLLIILTQLLKVSWDSLR